MPRGATVAGPTWSDYGACESCGSVAGFPCHRGTRELKNAHPGRPKTGQEPYSVRGQLTGDQLAAVQEHYDRPGPSMLAAGSAAGAWSDGCTCPDPMACLECCHDPSCPEAEDPRVWCECEHGQTCKGPCCQRSHDPARCPQRAAGSLSNGGAETTKETTVAMDPAAEAADWTARLDNAERLPKNPSGKRAVDAEIPKDVGRDTYERPLILRAVQQPDGTWAVPTFPAGPEPHAGRPIVELEGFTRASTLGNALEDGTGLGRWRIGMVVFGMSRRKDLVLAAQAVPGTEDKKLHRRPLYEIGDKALEAAEASSAATVGTALHALTEQADAGTLAVDIGEYQSVLDVYLERMQGWRVVRSETFVVSDYYHAAGTFDRLITPLEPMALVDQQTGEIIAVIMPGDMIVVDLKTSTTADYFGAKFFAQLAVYVTGQLYDRDPESPTYGARTPLGQRTDFALILHIPQGGDDDGEPVAEWHWLDMRAGLALAQLACVVLETRKKRFTRTHMRRVDAVVLDHDGLAEELADPESEVGHLTGAGTTAVPRQLPSRDALGDQHLEITSGFIAEAQSFPDAEADIVDAELVADHAEPEQRTPAPAALEGRNLGWIAERLAGRDPEDVIAGNEPGDAELIDALEAEQLPYDVPLPGGPHKGDDYGAERAGAEEAREHGDPQNWTDGGHVPGPEETAPLPAGWESREEQEVAAEATTEVPKGLGGKLQDAAARHAVEDRLIRKIQAATSVRGPDGLKDLYQRASAAGYWTDRVIAAASTRREELERRAAG